MKPRFYICSMGYTSPPSAPTRAAARVILREFVARSAHAARCFFGTAVVAKLDRDAYEIRARRDPQSALWTRHYITEVA